FVPSSFRRTSRHHSSCHVALRICHLNIARRVNLSLHMSPSRYQPSTLATAPLHLVRLQSSQLGDCRDSPSIQISNPEVVMNSLLRNSLSVVLLSAAAAAAPLGSSVRPAIPAEVQQLISVDYRMLKNSDTAQQLKNQVSPDQLKQFEVALRGAGIDPDRDVDQLTFVSYRSPKQGLEIVGAAQGVFATKTVLRKL